MIKKYDNRSKEKLYSVWKAMRKRCRNKNNSDYKYYGGRGIRVCNEWEDYLIFKKYCFDNGYNENLEIDRIDNNKDYCPENCRFIIHKENSRNRNNTKISLEDAQNIRKFKNIYGLTQQKIADLFHISRSHVANILINNTWN